MAGKQYGPPEQYEDKLAKVMQRFGAEEYNFDWGRRGGWVEFRINGVLYRFDHSVEKAQANGQKIQFGSDAFAQLVLALEDLARLTERGIYKLQTWRKALCCSGHDHIGGGSSYMSDNKKFMLRLVEGQLVIDMDKRDAMAFKADGYTGLPERFDLDTLCLAPVIGTVELSEEQLDAIDAAYENGGECAWCGTVAPELRQCHIFDRDPNGGKMCKECWDHDRAVYKGSYGEDIGPFKPAEEVEVDE